MAILHFSQLKKWKSSSKKFLLYKTNRCQVETKEIILALELYRMGLKSQHTFLCWECSAAARKWKRSSNKVGFTKIQL